MFYFGLFLVGKGKKGNVVVTTDTGHKILDTWILPRLRTWILVSVSYYKSYSLCHVIREARGPPPTRAFGILRLSLLMCTFQIPLDLERFTGTVQVSKSVWNKAITAFGVKQKVVLGLNGTRCQSWVFGRPSNNSHIHSDRSIGRDSFFYQSINQSIKNILFWRPLVFVCDWRGE